jgi:hypothetical protein
MYSDDQIDAAVAAGAISADAAAALRAHIVSSAKTPAASEENFRLISGFNDIFVAIAAIILLIAVWWIGNGLMSDLHAYPKGGEIDEYGRYKGLGGLICAATAWGLAEYFTRIRRMAFPSIVFLVAMVIGLYVGLYFSYLDYDYAKNGYFRGWDEPEKAKYLAQQARSIGSMIIIGPLVALASFAHWCRFKAPIAVAAAVGALGLALLAAIFHFGGVQDMSADKIAGIIPPMLLILVTGICVFAYAMYWDISDKERATQRSDVAFWLHLLAAPMIAHSLFGMIGVTDGGELSGLSVGVVVGTYLLFALVAIAVDRRALLVSALAYVLIALTALFRNYGVVELNFAITALIIGSALLCLSAFWGAIRRFIVMKLPAGIQLRLPTVH